LGEFHPMLPRWAMSASFLTPIARNISTVASGSAPQKTHTRYSNYWRCGRQNIDLNNQRLTGFSPSNYAAIAVVRTSSPTFSSDLPVLRPIEASMQPRRKYPDDPPLYRKP
jgi:hypothetical protein